MANEASERSLAMLVFSLSLSLSYCKEDAQEKKSHVSWESAIGFNNSLQKNNDELLMSFFVR